MKAADYLNKYGDAFMKLTTEDDRRKMISEIADSFYQELREMMKVRHITTNRGLFHAVNELNAKWNAMARLFEKYYNVSPLRRDGFRNLIDLALKQNGKEAEETETIKKEDFRPANEIST